MEKFYNFYISLFKYLVKQEVQGLQAFVFSVVTVNDEHMKARFISMVQKKG